jgi:hypothetical protein
MFNKRKEKKLMVDEDKSFKYQLQKMNGHSNVTVWFNGEKHDAPDTHVNWDKIVAGVIAEDPEVVKLFHLGKDFARYSERVTTKYNQVFFDGDPINNALTDHIIELIRTDAKLEPTIKFFESLYENPGGGAQAEKSAEHSRDHLYRYVEKHGLELNDDGEMILYKGFHHNTDSKTKDQFPWTTSQSGDATVTDKDGNTYEYKGQKIPQAVGCTVELARSKVVFDPSASCAYGLHVATERFARGFGDSSETAKVIVKARDVVSIPTHDDEKIRVCRYRIESKV